MSHDHHEGLPNYDPGQILHDGCEECENAGRPGNVEMAIANLDAERFRRAWVRAAEWQQRGMRNVSGAEIPMLRAIWAVQVQLQRVRGLALGALPPMTPALRSVPDRDTAADVSRLTADQRQVASMALTDLMGDGGRWNEVGLIAVLHPDTLAGADCTEGMARRAGEFGDAINQLRLGLDQAEI